MKRLFKLPDVQNFVDYKKSIYLTVFVIYAAILVLVLTLPANPMGMAFIVTTPMLFVLMYLFRKILLNDIKVFKEHIKRYIPFILVGFVLAVALNILGNIISQLIGVYGGGTNQEAVISAFWQTPLLGVFALLIVAPISEELIFRRTIMVMVENKFLYYLLSAFLFGMAHVVIGFTFPSSFVFIFPTALAGLGYAFVYDKSNNIWCPIFVHLLSNALALAFLLAS